MPAWSMDGRQIAFVSDRRGMPGVYAMPLEGFGSASPSVSNRRGPAARQVHRRARAGHRSGDYLDAEQHRARSGAGRPCGSSVGRPQQRSSGTTPTSSSTADRSRRIEAHRATDLWYRACWWKASNETVIPGLIEIHSHLRKAYGESLGLHLGSHGALRRVRNPGYVMPSRPGGARGNRLPERGVGPHVRSTTGEPFDGTHIYFPGGTTLDGGAGSCRSELQRAERLGYNLVKRT